MEHYTIPDFMREHYQEADVAGKHHIERLAYHYSEERAVFLQTIYVAKQGFLRDWNRLTGEKQQLTVNEALAPMRERYAEQAKRLVMEHSHEKPAEEQAEQNNTEEKQKAEDEQESEPELRQAFLANVKSMRERAITQQLRACF